MSPQKSSNYCAYMYVCSPIKQFAGLIINLILCLDWLYISRYNPSFLQWWCCVQVAHAHCTLQGVEVPLITLGQDLIPLEHKVFIPFNEELLVMGRPHVHTQHIYEDKATYLHHSCCEWPPSPAAGPWSSSM